MTSCLCNPPVLARKPPKAKQFAPSTRHSLQFRAKPRAPPYAASHCARAARDGCARCTQDGSAYTRASTRGGAQPSAAVPVPGCLDSQDPRGASPPASAGVARADNASPNRSAALVPVDEARIPGHTRDNASRPSLTLQTSLGSKSVNALRGTASPPPDHRGANRTERVRP